MIECSILNFQLSSKKRHEVLKKFEEKVSKKFMFLFEENTHRLIKQTALNNSAHL